MPAWGYRVPGVFCGIVAHFYCVYATTVRPRFLLCAKVRVWPPCAECVLPYSPVAQRQRIGHRQARVRATLLESNPDVALVLPCVFTALGIPLTVVGAVEAVRRATRNADLDDFIIVDCSLGHADDRTRCVEVVRQTALGVHIIYDPAAPDYATFRRDIERLAPDDVKWLPATVGLVEFLTILRDLRDQVIQARALSGLRQQPLTDHQRRVWALVAAGRSHATIARELGSSAGAVKQDIARIKDKLGVATTEQLKVAYRWTTDR